MVIFTGTYTEWLFVQLFEGQIGIWKCWFWGGTKTGVPREKPSEQGKLTNTKINPHMTPRVGIEPRTTLVKQVLLALPLPPMNDNDRTCLEKPRIAVL